MPLRPQPEELLPQGQGPLRVQGLQLPLPGQRAPARRRWSLCSPERWHLWLGPASGLGPAPEPAESYRWSHPTRPEQSRSCSCSAADSANQVAGASAFLPRQRSSGTVRQQSKQESDRGGRSALQISPRTRVQRADSQFRSMGRSHLGISMELSPLTPSLVDLIRFVLCATGNMAGMQRDFCCLSLSGHAFVICLILFAIQAKRFQLSIEGRAADPKPPGDLRHLPPIVGNGVPDQFGLQFF